MRENMGLYRGKRKDNGEWVEGFYVRLHDSKGHESHRIYSGYAETDCGDYYPDWHEVIPETIGEYSGLPDKNGKRIFEGDVFRMDEDDIAVVVFKDGCFRLEIHGLCGTFTESGFDECGGGYGVIECDPIDWYYVRDMEVIGDNPELLEVRE